MTEKTKILLVDDSATVGRHISGLLSNHGYEVYFSMNLANALEDFRKNKPQALVIDFVLEAGQTGLSVITAIFALAEQLNSAKPAEKRRPAATLLTMGHLELGDAAEAKKMGVHVLQKPKRGHEADFLQELEFWLRDAGVA
jgi:CheY-like chemotaxis protein